MAKQNSMDVIKVKYKGSDKPVNLADFLNMKEGLTSEEVALQEALKFLYDINAKDPPLFEKFPDWHGEEKPLTIDCTTLPKGAKDRTVAAFNVNKNNITFAKSSKEIALVGILAHELKHAEQSSKELYEMIYKKGKDNLGIQQIRFLEEAQAYVFGNYVQMLFFQKDGPIDDLDEKMLQKADLGTEKLLPRLKEWMREEPKIGFWDKVLGRTPQKNYKDLEQELIPTMLDVLYRSPYKVDYDEIHPVQKKDKGLSHIPEGFSLNKNFKKGILKRKLREVPKDKWFSFIDFMLAPTKEALSQILQNVLKQEDEHGNGVLEQQDYQELMMELNGKKDIQGMVTLLTKKNDKGVSWLDTSSKEMALSDLLTDYPTREVIGVLKEMQSGPSPVFHNFRYLGDEFWQPKSDATEQEIKEFYTEKEQLIGAFFGGWENYSANKCPRAILDEAIRFGHTGIVKKIISERQADGTLAVSKNNLKRSFLLILNEKYSATLGISNEKYSATKSDYMKKQTSEILSIFLDLKDEKGQPVIDTETLKNFTEILSPEETPTVYHALKQYQAKHPEDTRFERSDWQKFLKSNQKQAKGNDSKTLAKKLSKYAEDGKNMVLENNSQTTLSLGQQAVLNAIKPQH